MNKNFKFVYRNPGHWDVYLESDNSSRRAAVIRGEFDKVTLFGYQKPFEIGVTLIFPSVELAMSHVCATIIKEC
jgi:hypothetical protein